MKVTEDQIRAACVTAGDVYEGKLKRAEGILRLVEEHGVNEASAGDFINDYRCLAEGRVFQRAMSAAAMRHFIAAIERKHGTPGLANAVKSLRAHIDYYEGYSGTRMHEMRRVADEAAARAGGASESLLAPAYLLTWNPEHFKIGGDGPVAEGSEQTWTCHSKQPAPGDRVYLAKLGAEPRGIVATGKVTAPSFEAPHWKDAAKPARYIRFQVEEYRPDAASGMAPMALLVQAIPGYKWSPQSSGVAIPKEDEDVLQQLWSAGAARHSLQQYVYWINEHLETSDREWLDAYRTTVEQATSLHSGGTLDEKTLALLWRAPNNGISNVGPGALPTAEFQSNLPLLGDLTRSIVADPSGANVAAMEARWREAVAEGSFSVWNRAVIRRVFAAVAPDRYTTMLREADCSRVLRVLRTQFQLQSAALAPDKDWAALNRAIADCVEEAGLGKLSPETNIALWMLARTEEAAPATEIPLAMPHDGTPDQAARPPRNLVLFGPPGTGKTYSTVEETLALLAPELLKGTPDRGTLKTRFDELVASGQVVFTTFHQSFTYEDFVEGLRAEPRDEQLEFRVVDGVFKKLCKSADGQRRGAPFKESEVIAGYTVKRCTREVIEFIKPNGRILPLPLSILQELGELVRAGKITTDDVRDKRVFEKMPDSALEPHLVNGYANIFAPLVARFVDNAPTAAAPPPARVLIIDEINRGNVSRIFGELITLIEVDKRAGMPEALQVTLPYSKESFSVPANVHIIATMNTADRSLVGLDIALRRRFEFKELTPRPELLADVIVETISLEDLLRTINSRIEVLLDREHCLGHAHFLPLRNAPNLAHLAHIFRGKIVPMLQEYFYDDWERIRWVLNDHRKPPEQQFVRLAGIQAPHLFGQEVTLSTITTRWELNDAAFEDVGAYEGILSSQSQ